VRSSLRCRPTSSRASASSELSRPGGRKFQVEFDLTKTVAAPPTPWGY